MRNVLISHNFLFTFDRKYLKLIAFSKQDGFKMNGPSIELGKKLHCFSMQLLL